MLVTFLLNSVTELRIQRKSLLRLLTGCEEVSLSGLLH
jgi:hypothetical protein